MGRVDIVQTRALLLGHFFSKCKNHLENLLQHHFLSPFCADSESDLGPGNLHFYQGLREHQRFSSVAHFLPGVQPQRSDQCVVCFLRSLSPRTWEGILACVLRHQPSSLLRGLWLTRAARSQRQRQGEVPFSRPSPPLPEQGPCVAKLPSVPHYSAAASLCRAVPTCCFREAELEE